MAYTKDSTEHKLIKSGSDMSMGAGVLAFLYGANTAGGAADITMPMAVVVAACLVSSAFLRAAYAISRGLAKTEVRPPS